LRGIDMETKEIFWAVCVLSFAGLFLLFSSGVAGASGTGQQVNGAAQGAPAQQYVLAGAPAPSQAESNGDVQEITLTVSGSQYYPYPIRVKKGIPVRISVDTPSVTGCARSIVVPDFGVSKTVRAGDNVIEFTPEQSGTFDFGCSMWMYTGKIVVEEADGTVAAFTGDAPKAAAGSCGGSSGGCGCGRAGQ